MRPARSLVRWLADWRNLATIIAAALVAMLLVGFLTTLSDRQHLLHQLDARQGQITALTKKVDGLQTELEQVLAAHSDSERDDVVQRFEQQRAATAASTAKSAARPTSTTSTSTRPTSTSSPPTSTSTSTTTTTAPECRRVVGGVCVKPITVP